MTEQNKICTFFLGENRLGLPITHIRDVMTHQAITPVPTAPDVVEGLLNLRGQIVTALELRKRIGLPPRSKADAPMNLVIEKEDELYSLLVDDVGDMIEVESETFEAPPETLADRLQRFAVGVHKLDDLLLILDLDRVLDFTNKIDVD